MSKFDRMKNTLPSFYKAEVNTYIRGLLQAWGLSDDEVSIQIKEARNQIFVKTSEGNYLDKNANNYGVERFSDLSIDDSDFRELVPVLSTNPKQVRNTLVNLFDVFWGPIFTRANVTSGNVGPFDLGTPLNITGTLAFKKDSKLVKGTGTAFTTDLILGDYIRPSNLDDTHFAKVSRIISDTELELSVPWEHSNIALINADKKQPSTLSYEHDSVTERVIRVLPSAFKDVTAATTQEIADFINNHPEHSEHITASVISDPLSGNSLNIRTNTPGISGAIKITGGTLNTISLLNFSTNKSTETRATVYEVNSNEIVVKIPSSIPIVKRTLKGVTHLKTNKAINSSNIQPYDMNSLGVSSTLELTIQGNPVTVTLDHFQFANSERASAYEVIQQINEQLDGLEAFTKEPGNFRNIGLRTTNANTEYQVTGGTANTILGFSTDLQQDDPLLVEDYYYPGAFVFDPENQPFTVTEVKASLSEEIGQGTARTTIALDNAANFPNEPGQIIFDFGRDTQEGPITYNSRPNNSSLLIDASYIFQENHTIGRSVNLITPKATEPRITGLDYATFVTDTQKAREAAQELIKKIIASGVIVRFIIDFPDYLFECEVTVPDDPDYVGSLTNGSPLFTC